MAITLLQTVEQSFATTPKTHYILSVLKIISLLLVGALVIISAELVNACDKNKSGREPTAIESIKVSQNLTCDFSCSTNTETSADLYACERAQQKCELNSHLPLNTRTIGRN